MRIDIFRCACRRPRRSLLLRRPPRIGLGGKERQVETYNARDIDAFLACFADDALLVNLDDGKVLASGKEEMRPRYVERFKSPELHCDVVGRLAMGDTVVDREIIRGPLRTAHCLAVYTVRGGVIVKAAIKMDVSPTG